MSLKRRACRHNGSFRSEHAAGFGAFGEVYRFLYGRSDTSLSTRLSVRLQTRTVGSHHDLDLVISRTINLAHPL
jgi:hypothetical protein